MSRNELIAKLKTNFDIRELVCPHCYDKFKDNAWQFLSTELLSILYTLRYQIFKKPITINDWHKGGNFSQRGLRCNMCDEVKNKTTIYLSAHCLGKAIDFNVKDMTSNNVNITIKDCTNQFRYPIRLETNTNGWTHIDVYQPYGSNVSLIEFKG